MILLDENSTRDGLLSAIHVIALLAKTGKNLSELSEVVALYPHILVNVSIEVQASVGWR